MQIVLHASTMAMATLANGMRNIATKMIRGVSRKYTESGEMIDRSRKGQRGKGIKLYGG